MGEILVAQVSQEKELHVKAFRDPEYPNSGAPGLTHVEVCLTLALKHPLQTL